jgi:hypothetical protein
MDTKVLEMAVDLTKAALTPAVGGPWVSIGPEKVNVFLEEIAKKLHQLHNQT